MSSKMIIIISEIFYFIDLIDLLVILMNKEISHVSIYNITIEIDFYTMENKQVQRLCHICVYNFVSEINVHIAKKKHAQRSFHLYFCNWSTLSHAVKNRQIQRSFLCLIFNFIIEIQSYTVKNKLSAWVLLTDTVCIKLLRKLHTMYRRCFISTRGIAL